MDVLLALRLIARPLLRELQQHAGAEQLALGEREAVELLEEARLRRAVQFGMEGTWRSPTAIAIMRGDFRKRKIIAIVSA